MSDSQTDQNNEQPRQQPTGVGDNLLTVHTQYVRDLSFENPNAPQSLSMPFWLPNGVTLFNTITGYLRRLYRSAEYREISTNLSPSSWSDRICWR